jgi:hypothetical protein
MTNIGAFPPESRPAIIQRATSYFTGDTDLAESLIKSPPIIINSQKLVAENERDTIFSRAATGNTLPVNPDDIDQDHLPVHMVDLEAKLKAHELRPWDMMDAAEYMGLVQHCSFHVERMVAVDASNKEAQRYIDQLQKLAAAGDDIIASIQEQEQAKPEGEPMSEKDRADVALKEQKLQLEAQKFGASLADQRGVQQQRDARTALAARNQALKEELAAHKVRADRADRFVELTQ